MPSEAARALVHSAIDESFNAIAVLQSGFDAAIQRLSVHAESQSGATFRSAASLTAAAVAAHADVRAAHDDAAASCAVPESTLPGRMLRERIGACASWMHVTVDRVAAVVDPEYQAAGCAEHLMLSTDGRSSSAKLTAESQPELLVESDSLHVAERSPPAPTAQAPSRTTSARSRPQSSAATRQPPPQLSASQLAVAGHLASSPYALGAEQEFSVTRPAASGKYDHVKSRVGEAIRGLSSGRSVLDNTPLDPFSNEALQRKLNTVTSGVTSATFSSDWTAVDRDATITDRRVARPAKDARMEGLLRNLPADRRDHVLYETAMRSVAKANAHAARASSASRERALASSNGYAHPSSSDADAPTLAHAPGHGENDSRASTRPPRPSTTGDSNQAPSSIVAEMTQFGSAPRVQAMHENANRSRKRPASAWASSTAGFASRTSVPASFSAERGRSRPQTAASQRGPPSMERRQGRSGSFRSFVENLRRPEAEDGGVDAEDIASGAGITMNVTSVVPRRPSPAAV